MTVFLRKDWGSSIEPPGGNPISGPVQEVYVHHFNSGIRPERTVEGAKARVRGAQAYHAYGQGWGDIGYSWLVDDIGNIYEGRGWFKTGAHTYGYNSKGYGLCWLGDSMSENASPAALGAFATVVRMGIEARALVATPTIVAHKDRVPDTSCCGTRLYDELAAIRALVTAPSFTTPPVGPTFEDNDMRFVAFRIPNGQVFIEDLQTGVRRELLSVMPQGTAGSVAMQALAELVAAGFVKGGANGAPYTGLGWEANWALDQLDDVKV